MLSFFTPRLLLALLLLLCALALLRAAAAAALLWWQIRRRRLSERVEAFALPGTHLESPVEELEGVPETPHGGSPRALRVCIVGAVREQYLASAAAHGLCGAKLTRTPRYAYQPPALGTYRTHRAACPQGATYCTYGVRVPASGVPCVLRTVAPQVRRRRAVRRRARGADHAHDGVVGAGGGRARRAW